MGLIITSEIQTSGGATSEAYLNVSKYTLNKGKAIDAWISLYFNKADRDENERKTVESYEVYSRLGISELTDLETKSIYQFTYAELKEKLEEKGLTVIDDI